jgi:putative transposase
MRSWVKLHYMSAPRYVWRQLHKKQRAELLAWRKQRGYPWHSPPHRSNFGHLRFLISASCYEHRHYIGYTPERMDLFSCDLLMTFTAHAKQTFAWCVLPNHYHALVEAPDIKLLLHELGLLHGRTSHAWNGEDETRGRKVFFRAVERGMRSERHYWATLNYVHHNPVRHSYVERWTDWPWSSAAQYLAQTGLAEAKRIWRDYPVRDYGKNWDEPEI